MVPHVANQGHSFKGAGMYYLHDKQSRTKERVVWTETINLPTNDPEKAMGFMAHTSMNANRLKRLAGVSSTGRKNKLGDVYAVSLSWHPDQQPDKETMLRSANEILEGLGLQDHQAVIVAHNDTAHPHIHVICNLIHPENGKKAVPSYDWLTLSHWAENLERNDGKILCEQRVENNKKRKEQGQDNKMKLVKHKEKQLDIAPLINELYQQSDSGKAFQAALEEKGFTLAEGNKRAFTLVDEEGNIYNLARQLEGQRTKDIRERLKDIQELPMAKALSDERQVFDRDKYEAEWQKKIVDAAIEEDQKKGNKRKKHPQKPKDEEHTPDWKAIKNYDTSHLDKLDALQKWEREKDAAKYKLEQKLEKFYQRKALIKLIRKEETAISNSTLLEKLNSSKQKEKQERLKQLKKRLENMDSRIAEAYADLDKRFDKIHPDKNKESIKNQPKNDERTPDWKAIKNYDTSHLDKLDALQKWERSYTRKKHALEEKLEKFYRRKELVKQIDVIKQAISKPKLADKLLPGKLKEQLTHLENLEKQLANVDMRMNEQYQALEKKMQKEHPDNIPIGSKSPKPKGGQGRDFEQNNDLNRE